MENVHIPCFNDYAADYLHGSITVEHNGEHIFVSHENDVLLDQISLAGIIV